MNSYVKGIEVKSVTKCFGDTKALNNVNLVFEEEKIYGLLGRNGAGKSTLLNIINNRMHADSGEILLNGENVWENDRLLHNFYFISENMLFPENMKVMQAYRWTKEFYPDFDHKEALRLSELFSLPIKKKTNALSTGYKSIFKNIIALSINTPFVFFDEPVLGLDANHRDLFYRLLIEKYSHNPFTAVISTHLIEEAANLIEDIIIIKNGEIIKNESKEELLANGYAVSGPAAAVDHYTAGKSVINTDTLGGLKTAYIIGKPEACISDNLEFFRMDLQKLFIQLTNI